MMISSRSSDISSHISSIGSFRIEEVEFKWVELVAEVIVAVEKVVIVAIVVVV